MYDSAFAPQLETGTWVVGVTATQVPPFGGQGSSQPAVAYRIRCLVTGYLQFEPSRIVAGVTTAPTGMAAVAPSAGTASVNTIGMSVGQTEVFTLPPNCWFVSSNALGFEITAGEGL